MSRDWRGWVCDHADGILLSIFVVLVSLTLLMLATGCTVAGPSAMQPVGNAIAASEAYRATAFQHADQPSVVRWALGDEGQKRTLDDAAKSLESAEQAYAAEHDARLRAEADLRQERDQWLGDRGKRYFWTVALSAIGVWLGVGLLGTVLSVTTGGASVWAGFIFKLIPLGGLFAGLARRAA